MFQATYFLIVHPRPSPPPIKGEVIRQFQITQTYQLLILKNNREIFEK